MASLELRKIAGALSSFWSGGGGPPRSAITQALVVAGHSGQGLANGNKSELVLNAIVQAEDSDARAMIDELVDLLRNLGAFDSDSATGPVSLLRRAFDATDNLLNQDGTINWASRSRAQNQVAESQIDRRSLLPDVSGGSSVSFTKLLLHEQDKSQVVSNTDLGGNSSSRDASKQQNEAVLAPNKREIFVIHGRDAAKVQFFFDLMRRLDLRPLEFDELIARSGSGSPYIGDIVRSAFDQAQAVVVLFTGDDLAHIRPELGEVEAPTPQPRPNVFLEAGMAIALQRDRTIIVEVPPIRPVSDLHGVHVIRFTTGSAEERNKLASRLRTAGCELNSNGQDWLTIKFPT